MHVSRYSFLNTVTFGATFQVNVKKVRGWGGGGRWLSDLYVQLAFKRGKSEYVDWPLRKDKHLPKRKGHSDKRTALKGLLRFLESQRNFT